MTAQLTDQLTDLQAFVASEVKRLLDQRRIPTATYRVQFNENFTFRDAEALVPYLHMLGISHLYASPIFKSRSGSTHGYDVCDHGELSPVLGGMEAFERLSSALRDHDIGLILDTVPNHMGIGDPCNGWWMDVLENGPSSPYATYFDIDWNPTKPEMVNKVLLPILEDQYGVVLEDGKLKLIFEDGAFFVTYYENKLPIAPGTYKGILSDMLDRLTGVLDPDSEHLQELQSILTALTYLPPRTETDPVKLAERIREKDINKRRLSALVNASPTVKTALDQTLDEYNGTVGDPRSMDKLDTLLDAQPYRPAFWRVAAEEINYRRFFDINDLAAIRVELPEVFEATHKLIFALIAQGKIDGLRIDHPDGLWDPAHYFLRLQASYLRTRIRQPQPADDASADAAAPEQLDQAIEAWLEMHAADVPPLYVVAEKILSETELLPHNWAIAGTTGYDFLNTVNGLFVDSANHEPFDHVYANFTGNWATLDAIIDSSKHKILKASLASELNSLAHRLERLNEKTRRYRDFTLNGLAAALREVIAALCIYRTYIISPESVSERDTHYIELAVEQARRSNPQIPGSIFGFIRDTWLLRNLDQFREEDHSAVIAFVMKFQQVTGPVMAKSVEDTAFYIYNRLVALNEVGGDPRQFGLTAEEFHRRNRERQRDWPHAMLATSTHDTKRSEDVRARIDVLSEIPGEWADALVRWKSMNAPHKTKVNGQAAPDANEEYLLYQTILGTWPNDLTVDSKPDAFAAFRKRIAAYMLKSAKEAKVHTSWINAHTVYDEALQNFVASVLDENANRAFLDDLQSMLQKVAFYGQFNSLSQQLLKLTAPGVPDLYQGTELLEFSLVDPDNRRPVDFTHNQSLLDDLVSRSNGNQADLRTLADELIGSAANGRLKLFVTARTLAFRRDNAALFTYGDYVPLQIIGDKADHVVAFQRSGADQDAIIVVPRLVASLGGSTLTPPCGEIWGNTALILPKSERQYRNLFTGETVQPSNDDRLSLSRALAHFPVTLLVS